MERILAATPAGAVSTWLVHRGWPVGRARKAIVIPGAFGVLFLIPAAYAPSLPMISLCFGIATFSYAAFSTMANTFPADLFAPMPLLPSAGWMALLRGLVRCYPPTP